MDITVLIKLGIAAVLGLLIGLERELKHKPLGLKTCVVISVSSCLITIVSIESSVYFAEMSVNIRTDPMRLAAQIVSGIGFLGAGVILRRNNDAISGLTTAAIIWGASGLGVAAGAGFYYEAAVGTALILFAVYILPFLMAKIGPRKLRAKEMKIRMVLDDHRNMTDVLKEIETHSFAMADIRVKDVEGEKRQIDAKLWTVQNVYATDVYDLIRKIDGVVRVEIESL